MEYRLLGKSGLKVSSVAVGTWASGGWLWGGTDEIQAVEAIRESINLGITTIDTAPIYGFGKSEELVGRAISGLRDKVQVLTKCGLRWDVDQGSWHMETTGPNGKILQIYRNCRKESIITECEQSLRRLGSDYIDLYQIHWPDESAPIEEAERAFDQLKKDGKIRAAGVSNFSVSQLQTAMAAAPIASIQSPYSMLRRNIEKDLLPFCITNGIGVLAYSPLQLGILTGKVTPDRKFPPDDLRSKSAYFTPKNRRRVLAFLDAVKPVADRHEATLAQLVIAWTIRQPGITAALVGARNPRQARENSAAGGVSLKLSDQDIRQINAELQKLVIEI